MQEQVQYQDHERPLAGTVRLPDPRPNWPGTLLVLAVPMLAAVAYGAVDVWAFILLSVLTAALLAAWLVEGLRRRELRIPFFGLQVPLLGLILIGIIQLLPLGGVPAGTEIVGGEGGSALSLDPYATRLFVTRLILLFVFFSAAAHFLRGAAARRFAAAGIVIFGSLMAFIGILQRLASPDAIYGMRATPQAIPFGPFVNQHHFAAMMEMTLGLTLGFILGGTLKRDRKGLFTIAAVLMSIAVLMTGSRGGLLASVAVVVSAAVFSRRSGEGQTSGRSWKGMALGTAAVVLVGAAVVFLQGADPLVRALGLQANQEDPTSGRLHFWSIALKIFADNPVIGAGHEAFAVAFTRYDSWNGVFRVEQAHNDYLQMLADGGILAFACVLAFVLLLLKNGAAALRRTKSPAMRSVAVGALAGCIGIMIHSLFDFPLRTPSNAFFVLLLAAILTAAAGGEREFSEHAP